MSEPRSVLLPTCGYGGNSDIYGLGIRAGVYLQWISCLLAKVFLNEDALRDVLNEHAVFLLAIFLATVVLVTNAIDGVHSVDILIMLHIFFGSVYAVLVDENTLTRVEYLSSLFGILFKSAVVTGMAAIGVWFWFWGISVQVSPECNQYAFLFGRVDLYSASTIMAFKAFSIINLVCCAVVLSSTVIFRYNIWLFTVLYSRTKTLESSPVRERTQTLSVKIRRWIITWSIPSKTNYYEQYIEFHIRALEEYRANRIRPMKLFVYFNESSEVLLRVDVHFNRVLTLLDKVFDRIMIFRQQFLERNVPGMCSVLPEAPPARNEPWAMMEPWLKEGARIYRFGKQLAALVLNLTVVVYSIIGIELLIIYNSVTDVYTLRSTGQIVPFVLGLASLWRVAWKIVTGLAAKELASTGKGIEGDGVE